MTMGIELARPRHLRAAQFGRRGRPQGESAAEITATVKAQRVKLGAEKEDAGNALHGTTLGQLHRRWQLDRTNPGGISADQYNAGQAYIATVFRYCQIMGIAMPWPPGANTRATSALPDEEVVLAARRRFSDMRRALLDCGREIGQGSRVNAAVYRICIEDPPLSAVFAGEIENLRYGLNAIGRYLR